MDLAKCLQITGLSLAFLGTILVSTDVVGKEGVHRFLNHWSQKLKRHRFNVSVGVGLAVAVVAVVFIDTWKALLIGGIVPLMFSESVVSTCLSTVVALAMIQLVIGGRASYKRIGITIKTTAHASYGAVSSPNRLWPLAHRLKDWMVGVRTAMGNPSRIRQLVRLFKIRIVSILHVSVSPPRITETLRETGRRAVRLMALAYFPLAVLVPAVVYIATRYPAFWALSVSMNLGFTITFSLIAVGFPLVVAVSIGLRLLIREDADKTLGRLGVSGLVLLASGFILQLVGVVMG